MNIAIGAFMMLLGFLVMMHGMDASLARESHLIDLHLANGARYHMWANLPVSPAAGEEIVFGKHRLVVTESRAVMSSDKHIWTSMGCREIGKYATEESDEICEAELVKLGFKQDKPPQPNQDAPSPELQFERIELPDGSVVL
jgi:hypothetical protein